MDRGYEKEQFTTISFKLSTAKKFRKFRKELGKSNSMALSLMVEFFEHNKISPQESLGPQMKTLENLIKKRNNAIIAIMKSIEKDQTKPTIAILHSLLEGGESKTKPLIIEKKPMIEKRELRFQEKKNRLKQ